MVPGKVRYSHLVFDYSHVEGEKHHEDTVGEVHLRKVW